MSDNNSSISTTEIQNLVAGGEFKKALDALDGKDIQVSKRDFYYFKAVCYRYLKDHKNAHLSLNELIKYFPNYARANQELGYIYSIKNDEKKTLRAFVVLSILSLSFGADTFCSFLSKKNSLNSIFYLFFSIGL